MKHLFQFAVLFILSVAAHAQTSAGWRLRSFGLERYDGFSSMSYKPADSAQYYYSGNHLGEPTFAWLEDILRSYSYRDRLYRMTGDLQYDSVHTYRGSSTQSTYSDANIVYAQSFNNTLITGRTRLSSGNVTAQETYTYNGNLLTESIATGDKSTIVYNSNQVPDTIHYFFYNTSNQAWVASYSQYFVYDGNGRLTQMKEISATSALYNIYDYYYNSSNLPEHIVVTLGGIQPDDTATLYSYTYTANNDLATEMRRRNDGAVPQSPDLINYDRHVHTYDSKHNRIEDLTYNWNKTNQVWDTFSKWTYTYTNDGLPETFESLRWDYTSANWALMQDTNDFRTSHRMRLHYEIAWPVNITHQQANQPTIQLYPNPAGGIFTFRISTETAQPLTACITDMQGRVLMQWKEAATKEYTRTIPTVALPAGTYVLKVTGEGWEQAKMFSIR